MLIDKQTLLASDWLKPLEVKALVVILPCLASLLPRPRPRLSSRLSGRIAGPAGGRPRPRALANRPPEQLPKWQPRQLLHLPRHLPRQTPGRHQEGRHQAWWQQNRGRPKPAPAEMEVVVVEDFERGSSSKGYDYIKKVTQNINKSHNAGAYNQHKGSHSRGQKRAHQEADNDGGNYLKVLICGRQQESCAEYWQPHLGDQISPMEGGQLNPSYAPKHRSLRVKKNVCESSDCKLALRLGQQVCNR